MWDVASELLRGEAGGRWDREGICGQGFDGVDDEVLRGVLGADAIAWDVFDGGVGTVFQRVVLNR